MSICDPRDFFLTNFNLLVLGMIYDIVPFGAAVLGKKIFKGFHYI